MGSHTTINGGFDISYDDIDQLLGVITSYPGQEKIVRHEDRYSPKTGEKLPSTKTVISPEIPPFESVSITFEGYTFVDRLRDAKTKVTLSRRAAEAARKLIQSDWTCDRKAEYEDEYYGYQELMNTVAERLSCTVVGDNDWFVLGEKGFTHYGAVRLDWLDSAEIRTKIQNLKNRLEQFGFKNLSFSLAPIYHE